MNFEYQLDNAQFLPSTLMFLPSNNNVAPSSTPAWINDKTLCFDSFEINGPKSAEGSVPTLTFNFWALSKQKNKKKTMTATLHVSSQADNDNNHNYASSIIISSCVNILPFF